MAEPKLPLIARKNIKENEEKLTEHKERIAKVVELSTDITIDADYPTLHAFADKNGYQNRCGDVSDWFLDGLSRTIERVFAEETAKAALQSNWTTGVIRFRVGTNKKGENKYHSVDIDNGDLVLTYFSISNTSDIGSDLLGKLGDASTGLTVISSQNVKETEEKRTEALQAIQQSTGLSSDVTIDIDWVLFAGKAEANGYKDRVGDCLEWLLDGLKYQMKRNFEESDIAKQAIQDAWTTGVIKFEWGTLKKGEYGYQKIEVRDGDLVVTVYSFSNSSDCGSGILEKLTETATGLPLKSSLNLKENEEKKEENLKKIQDAVGLSTDVTVDVDWAAIDAYATKNGYQNRIGDIVYDWVLGGLSYNIDRICKEELTKEALQEVWTTGVIRFEENKKVSYHAVVFNNGDLIIQYNALTSNTSAVGEDIESKL